MLLDEFCTYIKEKEIADKTKLGKCLAEEAPAPSAEKIAELKKLKESAASQPKPPPAAVLATKFGLKLYKGVSKELVQFVRLFMELGETGKRAEEMRQEAFVDADP